MNEFLDYVRPFAEQISLALTVPTIVFCIWVVFELYRVAWQAVWSRNKTAIQWFILGIAISFFGDAIDNLYWGIAWASHYLDIAAKEPLFANGVFSNIPFRQTAGILAGYCHIRGIFSQGSEHSDREKNRLNFVLKCSLAVGIALVMILWILKSQ